MWLGYVFFFKQRTAYEMRISDWSSDVCSSDLLLAGRHAGLRKARRQFVVMAEQAGMLMAERHEDRARQCGQIDHEARLEAVIAVPQRIAEYEEIGRA